MKFKILIAAAAMLAVAGEAAAQDADRAAHAREVVELMQVEHAIGEMFGSMAPMMAASMGQTLHLTPVEQARLGVLLQEELRQATPALMSDLAQVYAHDMSDQQLTDVITFLRSPSGQAWLQTQQTAKTELERIGQEFGMRVALQAITRLNAERSQQR